MGRRGGGTGGAWAGLDAVHAEYRQAKATRFRRGLSGVPALGAGADFHFSNGAHLRIMEMARDLDRHDEVVGQGVTRFINLVFRGGLTLAPWTGDAGLDQDLKARFEAWANDPMQCDARERETLAQMGKAVGRAVLVDGDHVVLPLRDRRLQLVEAHRLVTPSNARGRKDRVVHGVRVDGRGRPVEYWLSRDDRGFEPVIKVGDIKKYAARDADGEAAVWHVLKPDRVSQTRGISSFARILEPAVQHGDLQWAALVAAQAQACIAFFREVDKAAAPMSGGAEFGAGRDEVLGDGTTRRIHELVPGMEITGRPGEKIQGFSPTIPHARFFEHSMVILTFIAINLGVPVMVLLLDPKATNFSGWRGAMEIAKAGFEDYRDFMRTQFYRRVYRWWLRGELAADPRLQAARERAGAVFFRHEWGVPYDPYIDPAKDAAAEEKIIGARLDSRRALMLRRGLDLDVVDADIVGDEVAFIGRCIAGAAALERAHPGCGVTWRDLFAALRSTGASPPPAGGGAAPVREEDEDA